MEETETGDTVTLCRICGYVKTDCVTHRVHPLIETTRQVPRKSPEHLSALSTYHNQHEHYRKREKAV